MKRIRPQVAESHRTTRTRIALVILGVISLVISALFLATRFRGPEELLHISSVVTPDLFHELDRSFENSFPGTGARTSRADSIKQAQALIRGFRANVVSLSTAEDLDAIMEKTGTVEADWRNRFPHGSSPFTSTIVFLVRSGNPENVIDWSDLIRKDVHITIPRPDGNEAGRLAFLSAWTYSIKQNADKEAAEQFVTQLYSGYPTIENNSRGAMHSFMKQNHSDVLVTWESEALKALHKYGSDAVQVVYPSISLRFEPVVAVVNQHRGHPGRSETAVTYLDFIFSREGQEIASRHYLRPRDQSVKHQLPEESAKVELVSLKEILESWTEVEKEHFSSKGTVERILQSNRLSR